MTLLRTVAAEALDHLAADDPAARRSRRDLRRIHRAMGTRAILLRGLRGLLAPRADGRPLRVLELGAGDGRLLLGVARALGAGRAPVALTLLDRQRLVEPSTLEAYAALGWRAAPRVVDALDWAAATAADAEPRWDLIVANLFLHHFEGDALARLLAAVAERADAFFACEPRRAWTALIGSHLVGALGANAVTREDAVLSVHAGFRAAELEAAWPARAGWTLREHDAGLFSHCFLARRTEHGDAHAV